MALLYLAMYRYVSHVWRGRDPVEQTHRDGLR